MNSKLILLLAFIGLPLFAFAQDELNLIGDFTPCETGCYEYYYDSLFQTGEIEIWNTYEPAQESHTIEVNWGQSPLTFTICYRLEGSYGFEAYVYTPNGNMVSDSFHVEVGGFGEQIQILELDQCSPEIPVACKGQTASYAVDPPIFGVWEVTGATSYTQTSDGSVTVDWGDGDSGTLVFIPEIFNPDCYEEASMEVKLIDRPESSFEIENMKSSYCLNEDIFFINNSTGGTKFLWDFGDGTTSTDVQPSHAYENSGQYIISLVATNLCGCDDVYAIEVNIDDAWMPQIDCKGTLCSNTTQTYTCNDNCGIFNWTVSNNGAIVEGGASDDNYVTIDWGEGPIGKIVLEVQSCSGDVCPTPAEFIVPIISDGALIQGNLTPCIGSTESYAITDYGGTEISWMVNGGNIIAGSGTHAIIVKWNGLSSGTIAVSYNNCYLECGGSSTQAITMIDAFETFGNTKTCTSEGISISAQEVSSLAPAIVDWNLYDESGSFITSTNNASTFVHQDDALSGNFKLVATNPNYCNDHDTIGITLTPSTLLPTDIEGETAICQSTAYQYQAISSIADASFEWTIDDGGNISTQKGKEILVEWNSNGPFSIELRQKNNEGDWCFSPAINKTITEVSDIQLTSIDDICVDESSLVTVPFYQGLDYSWSVNPATAATLISEQGKDSMTIQWIQPGTHTIILNVCGLMSQYTITVKPKPTIDLTYESQICYNVTTPVSMTGAFASYDWQNENGASLFSTDVADLGPGTYLVKIVNQEGCIQDENFTIKEFPKPEINISTPDSTGICPSAGSRFPSLEAVTSGGGYTYEWFKGDNSLSLGGNVLNTDDLGRYKVLVTDLNNCTAFSNSIGVFEFCGTCDGGVANDTTCTFTDCVSNTGIVDFDINSTSNCRTFRFANQSVNNMPDTYIWNFDDPYSGIDNRTTEENPSHTFSQPGYYNVILRTQVEDSNSPGDYCTDWISKLVTVPIKAQFAYNSECPESPIEFVDRSTYLDAFPIASYEWDFGDPSSADNSSTIANPNHAYASSGVYSVRLVIASGTGCTDTVFNEVIVYDIPEVDVVVDESQCEDIASRFTITPTNDIVKTSWTFGDPASLDKDMSAVFPTYHTYQDGGNYNVSAVVENIWGCTNDSNKAIDIATNNLAGDINSTNGSILCEGSTTTLSATTAGVTMYDWSTNETTATITQSKSDIYLVTVSDINGCTYTPDQFELIVNEAPKVSVYVATVIEGEESILSPSSKYEICGGLPLRFVADDNPDYSYLWASLGSGSILNLNEDQGNALPQGNHTITLMVTDNTNGCTYTQEIDITVLPAPQNLTIIADQTGILCGSGTYELSVDNPQVNTDYYWNSGRKSTFIQTQGAGVFYVEAINDAGCTSKSNVIIVEPGPDMNKVPSGCFVRCNPDTICMPSIPKAVSYQWTFNGVNVPPEQNGNQIDLIATSSGQYILNATDALGCTNASDPIDLTLQDAVGQLTGLIYVDVDNDGMISAADTLISGIDIILSSGHVVTSNADGSFTVIEIDAGSYTAHPDTTGLGLKDALGPQGFDIVSCDDSVSVTLLLTTDCTRIKLPNKEEHLCNGDEITIEGNTYDKAGNYVVYVPNAKGCLDSFDLTITESQDIVLSLTGDDACPNEDNGSIDIQVSAGIVSDYTYTANGNNVVLENGSINNLSSGVISIIATDVFGCEVGIENVTIQEAQDISLTLIVEDICPGDDNGSIEVEVSSGSPMDYTYTLNGDNVILNNGTLTNLPTGNMTVVVSNAKGCELGTANATIEEVEAINYDLIIPDFDCPTGSWEPEVDITSSGNTQVSWSNGVSDPIGSIDKPGWHSVTISNQCESLSEDFLLRRLPRGNSFEIPNVFSPNEDGNNDKFRLALDQLVDPNILSFSIVDRQGRMVHQYDPNKASSLEWSGKYHGNRDLPAGVYFYLLKLEHNECQTIKTETYSGDITILR